MILLSFITSNRLTFFKAALFGLCAGSAASVLLITAHHGLDLIHTGFQKKLVIQFCGAAVCYMVFYILSDKVLSCLSQEFISKFNLSLSNKILNARLSTIEKKTPSQLLDVFHHDLQIIGRVIEVTPKAIVDFFIFSGCLVYIAYLSVYVFLILILSSGIILTLYYFLNQHIRKKSTQIRHHLSQIHNHLHSLIFGIKELQLNSDHRHYFYSQRIKNNVIRYRNDNIRLSIVLSFFKRFIEVMLYTIVGALIFVVPLIFKQFPISTLNGFVLATLFLIKPIESLLQFIAFSAQFSVSMKTITQLESFLQHDPPLPVNTAKLTTFPSPISHLHLHDIRYAYFNTELDDSFTLGPITTTIRSGEITYIIGGNGSGKTTLGKLICGLYIPDKGHFSLNDTPIDHIGSRYRDLFSVILSDYYLFDHQLELKTADHNQVSHYINAFHLSHKVSFNNGQFSTLNLSSGQRKRLALIISFLQDRPIYIFDEWASDQDPEFKAIFYDEILPLLKQQNKIVIVITHDDFYFEKADRIIRLRNGTLCASSPS